MTKHGFLSLIYFLPKCILLLSSFLFKRNINKWIFGGFSDKYSDNVSYFFDYVCKNHQEIKAVWVTGDKNLVLSLRKQGYSAYLRWSFFGLYHSLTSKNYIIGCYVSDVNNWTFGSSNIINLFHGLPLKHIEYDIDKGTLKNIYSKGFNLYKLKRLIGSPNYIVKPDLLFAPSSFFVDIFEKAFRVPGKVKLSNSPRYDIMCEANKKSKFLHKSFDRVIIYAPTWRVDGSNPIESLNIDLNKINKTLVELNQLLVLRFHANTPKIHLSDYSNIEYDINSELYKKINEYDVLITDYSSLIFDFISINKPVLFLPYDKVDYLASDRGLYFDYEKLTEQCEYNDFFECILASSRIEIKSNIKGLNDIAVYDTAQSSMSYIFKSIKEL